MIYLDNAATTFPKPESVVREVSRCITEYCGNPGRGSHRLSAAASEAIYKARERLSRHFGCNDPSRCVFTLNTTYALNTALKSLVRCGDHILISDMEHNSVYRQVVKLKESGYAEYDIFRCRASEREIISDIARKTRPETRIVICQISSNVCSHFLPVSSIGRYCASRGIFFIADAAQCAGTVQIDTEKMNIDALCVPSHKGLYGPQGAGAVIFSEKAASLAKAVTEGGSGSNSLSPYMPDVMPDKFEAGTLPTPAIVGLGKGIEFVESTGLSRIAEHERALSRYLAGQMSDDKRFTLYGGADGAIVLFNVKDISPVDTASYLDAKGICVRAGFHCAPLAHKTLGTGDSGAVRVSFGAFNDISDVRALLDALASMK